MCNDNGLECLDTCGADEHCIPGNFCVGGVCSGKKADGTQCFDDGQCVSGLCTNGFCCGAA